MNTDPKEVRSGTVRVWGRVMFPGKGNIWCKPRGRGMRWDVQGITRRPVQLEKSEGPGKQEETSEKPSSLHGARASPPGEMSIWCRFEDKL